MWLSGLGLLGLPAASQPFSGAGAIGLGGSHIAAVRDAEALWTNPANLVFDERGGDLIRSPGLLLSIGHAEAFTGGDLLQFNFYNDTFTDGTELTADEKEAVLDGWFGGAMRGVRLTGTAVPLAVVWRQPRQAFGAALRFRTDHTVRLNGGWLDVLLNGTDTDRTIPLDAAFWSMTTTEVQVSYSRSLPAQRLAVGLSPRLILGAGYGEGTLTSTLTTAPEALTHDFDYTVRSAGGFSRDVVDAISLFDPDPLDEVDAGSPFGGSAGIGVGLDVGATYALNPNVKLALSLTDLGRIRWRGDAQTRTPVHHTYRFEGLTLSLDTLDNVYGGDLDRYARDVLDEQARAAYEAVERTDGGFSTALPATLHLGAAWTAGRTTLSGGLSTGLTSTAGEPHQPPVLYAGGEYRAGPVPLRAGLRLAGAGAFTLALGFGIHTRSYDFDLGLAFTPQSDLLGSGARFHVGLAPLTLRFR